MGLIFTEEEEEVEAREVVEADGVRTAGGVSAGAGAAAGATAGWAGWGAVVGATGALPFVKLTLIGTALAFTLTLGMTLPASAPPAPAFGVPGVVCAVDG
jgi:hypothetical protein